MKFDLPPLWRPRLADYTPEVQTIGESVAAVHRLNAAGREPLVLKSEPVSPFAELPAEAVRLMWLRGQHIPCAAVLGTAEHAGRHWLLMSAVDGRDMASVPETPVETIARQSAYALLRLHDLDVKGCPFDHRIERRLGHAKANLDAGRIDPVWTDASRTPAEGFAELIATRPLSEDVVVTHGDACLPNFMIEDGRFSGFVDCGRLGVADRWQDLALAIGSLERNFGRDFSAPFLDAYGLRQVDPEKLAWYLLLDEFF